MGLTCRGSHELRDPVPEKDESKDAEGHTECAKYETVCRPVEMSPTARGERRDEDFASDERHVEAAEE